MAKTENVTYTYTSDLSEKVIESDSPTLRFGLDGKDYEVDLTPTEQEKFRKFVQQYVDAGRAASSGAKPARRARKKSSGPTPAQVREWAAANGHEVSPKGRVPADVRKAYDDAHPAA